jgi:hypothetical protein
MMCPRTITIGAYVLGALEPEERRETERHLETCAACREALLQFAPLPGLLHAVPLEEVETDLPEPQPLQLTRKRSFKRRWLAVPVAAASGLAAWGLVAAGPAQAQATWSATDGVGGIDTVAKLTGKAWGTDIQLKLSDLEPDEQCMLVVHGKNGSTETAGWWAANGQYQATVPASTSIPLQEISSLQVVTAEDTVLSTMTPATR